MFSVCDILLQAVDSLPNQGHKQLIASKNAKVTSTINKDKPLSRDTNKKFLCTLPR